MVPAAWANYFLGSTGASSALIGLLFVAVAVAPESVFGRGASIERRVQAGSAFTALLNAFFLSLLALMPKANIGFVALILGLIGLANTLSLARHFREDRHAGPGVQRLSMLLASLVIYGLEVWFAVALLRQPRDTSGVQNLAYLLPFTYSLGVGRAWELLGAQDEGLFSLLGVRRTSLRVPSDSEASSGDEA
jgi:multisubunit Na+/H+ antiporter MnhF subunit